MRALHLRAQRGRWMMSDYIRAASAKNGKLSILHLSSRDLAGGAARAT